MDHPIARLRFCMNPAALERFFRRRAAWLVRTLYRPTYKGFHKLPQEGPAVLVCNHVSYMDGLILAAGSQRRIRFVIYEKIYRLPVIHYFMRLNRAIPILPERKSVEAALKAIKQGLEAGDLICIFPEGQITYTGGLGRFKPGVEYIIQQSAVPVYPMAIKGMWGSLFSRKHYGSWRRWLPGDPRNPAKAICGDPIPPEEVNVNHLQNEVLRLKYLI